MSNILLLKRAVVSRSAPLARKTDNDACADRLIQQRKTLFTTEHSEYDFFFYGSGLNLIYYYLILYDMMILYKMYMIY